MYQSLVTGREGVAYSISARVAVDIADGIRKCSIPAPEVRGIGGWESRTRTGEARV